MKNKTLKAKLKKQVRVDERTINAYKHRVNYLEGEIKRLKAELDGRDLLANMLASMIFTEENQLLKISLAEMQAKVDCKKKVYINFDEEEKVFTLKYE